MILLFICKLFPLWSRTSFTNESVLKSSISSGSFFKAPFWDGKFSFLGWLFEGTLALPELGGPLLRPKDLLGTGPPRPLRLDMEGSSSHRISSGDICIYHDVMWNNSMGSKSGNMSMCLAVTSDDLFLIYKPQCLETPISKTTRVQLRSMPCAPHWSGCLNKFQQIQLTRIKKPKTLKIIISFHHKEFGSDLSDIKTPIKKENV